MSLFPNIPDVSFVKVSVVDELHVHFGKKSAENDQPQQEQAYQTYEPDYADYDQGPKLSKKQRRKFKEKAIDLEISNETLTPMMGLLGIFYGPSLFMAANGGANLFLGGVATTALALTVTAPITIAYAVGGIKNQIPLKEVFRKPATAFALAGVITGALGIGIGGNIPHLPFFPDFREKVEACVPHVSKAPEQGFTTYSCF